MIASSALDGLDLEELLETVLAELTPDARPLARISHREALIAHG